MVVALGLSGKHHDKTKHMARLGVGPCAAKDLTVSDGRKDSVMVVQLCG